MAENDQKGSQNLNNLKARLGMRPEGAMTSSDSGSVPPVVTGAGLGKQSEDVFQDPFKEIPPVLPHSYEDASSSLDGMGEPLQKKTPWTVVGFAGLGAVGLIVGILLGTAWDARTRHKETTVLAGETIVEIEKQWKEKVTPAIEVLKKSMGSSDEKIPDFSSLESVKELKFEDADSSREKMFRRLSAGDMPYEIVVALYNYYYYLDLLQAQVQTHVSKTLGNREALEAKLTEAFARGKIVKDKKVYLVLQGQGDMPNAIFVEALGEPVCEKKICAPGEKKISIRHTYDKGKPEMRSIDLKSGGVVVLLANQFSRSMIMGQPTEMNYLAYTTRKTEIAESFEKLDRARSQVLDLLRKRQDHGK